MCPSVSLIRFKIENIIFFLFFFLKDDAEVEDHGSDDYDDPVEDDQDHAVDDDDNGGDNDDDNGDDNGDHHNDDHGETKELDIPALFLNYGLPFGILIVVLIAAICVAQAVNNAQ